MSENFFDGNGFGLTPPRSWRLAHRLRRLAFDVAQRAGLAVSGGAGRVRRYGSQTPRRRILVAGIEVPSRARDIHDVAARLAAGSRHEVVVSIAVMQPGLGKFANIQSAIDAAPEPLDRFDWLVILDDDVAFERGFLDGFIGCTEAAGFALSMPAHARRSHATYRVTQTKLGSLARRTRFVEIGPVTALHSSTFGELLPFPPSRWCYGIDVQWSEVALRLGWKIGVVDATPLRHLRPVAGSYDGSEAVKEGRAFLERIRPVQTRQEILGEGEVVLRC